MIFDDKASKNRVFGEQFNRVLLEPGLTRALEQHLSMLGRDPKEAEAARLTDGGMGRLNLILSAKTKEHDRIRRLLEKLRAPAVTGTDVEASQIKKYARAVVAHPQFADMRSEWDFVLLVTDHDDSVRRDISQEGRPSGILDQSRINQ